MIDPRTARQLGRLALAAFALGLLIAPARVADSQDAWAALAQGGNVALIRHGNAPPGQGGDPPGFRLDDCATQRNLDDAGRAQGRALGEAFRKHGVRVDRVMSSPWCRCVDTAELMAFGPVERSWALVPPTERNPDARERLKELISSWRGPGTLVLVTHAFTVRSLLGFLVSQAETVVLKPAPGSATGAQVVGLIPTPQ